MTIVEFVEKIYGIELLPYQKILLEEMYKHKDDQIALSLATGRFVFIPKQTK